MRKVEEKIDQVFEHFVRHFVASNRQERLLLFFKNKKNWWKIRNEFHTSRAFDDRMLLEIPPDIDIYAILKERGANDNCLSLLDYLDDEPYHCRLEDKLNDSVGFLVETIIYCPESNTGYYEGGHAKDRYILINPPIGFNPH